MICLSLSVVQRVTMKLSLLLLVGTITLQTHALGRLRGVPPARLELYTPKDGKFTCFDKSNTIPVNAVNDDYCDCADGSDEPGTSACPQNMFYCANEGYKPVSISSIRVDDGICDDECCDGSDEYLSKVKCPNKCVEFGKAMLKKRQEKMEQLNKGLLLKQEYIENGKNAVQERRQKLASLEDEIKQMDMKMSQLKLVKEEAQEHQRKTDFVKKVETKAKAAFACPAKLEKLETAFESAKGIHQTLKTKYNELVEILKPLDELFVYSEEENAEYEARRLKYSNPESPQVIEALQKVLKMFEERQLEPLQESFDRLEYDSTVAEPESVYLSPCESADAPFTSCLEYGWKIAKALVNRKRLSDLWASIMLKSKSFLVARLSDDLEYLKTNVDLASEKYREAERKRDELVTSKDDLKKKESVDFGPGNMFNKIYGTCLDYSGVGHDYSLCFLQTVKQNEKGSSWGGHDLGHFTRWGPRDPLLKVTDDLKGKYSRMMYEDGGHCSDVPARSTEVILQCGPENKILSVTEPSKCAYEIQMMSPAVCEEPAENSDHDEL